MLLSLGCRPFRRRNSLNPVQRRNYSLWLILISAERTEDPVPFHVVPMRGSGGNPLPRSVAAKPDTLSLRVLSYGRSDHAHPGNRRTPRRLSTRFARYRFLQFRRSQAVSTEGMLRIVRPGLPAIAMTCSAVKRGIIITSPACSAGNSCVWHQG